MHFSARSALLATCLAISVQALPVTYSVVDVDGGSAANAGNGGTGSPDQPATVYHTVTKSADAEEPEATTVSVSVTIVETEHASATSTASSSSSSSSSLSSSTSSLRESARPTSSASSPSATATDTLSAFQSPKSTFSTRPSSVESTPSGKPTITQAPPAPSASHASHTTSSEDCDCEASSITVTASVTDTEETITATRVSTEGQTVILFSTTTVTPAAEPTSYYDDGMWHTRYAIKPVASPKAESPFSKGDDIAPQFVDTTKPTHANQNVATNATIKAVDGFNHVRREIDTSAPTPTVPAIPNAAEGSGAPLMLIQPLLPEPTGTAVRVAPTGDAAAAPDVLSADDVPAVEQVARRASTYSVVSWNETTQG